RLLALAVVRARRDTRLQGFAQMSSLLVAGIVLKRLIEMGARRLPIVFRHGDEGEVIMDRRRIDAVAQRPLKVGAGLFVVFSLEVQHTTIESGARQVRLKSQSLVVIPQGGFLLAEADVGQGAVVITLAAIGRQGDTCTEVGEGVVGALRVIVVQPAIVMNPEIARLLRKGLVAVQ